MGLLLGRALAAAGADAWAPEQAGVRIPMRDGQSLAADVYLPAQPGAYPAVLIQTPYGRQRFGSAMPDVRAPDTFLDRDHYAFVILDWRGFYGSKDALQPGQVARRGQDGFDAVEWTARQPWCNGKVGTWGPSALGRVQFLTAMEQPPALACCVPIVASAQYTYEEYYENGVYREAHVRLLDRLGFDLSRFAYPAVLSSSPVYTLAARAVHPERLQVPMLMITGWYDPGVARQMDTFRMLREHAAPEARSHARLVIGPWTHTAVGLERQGELRYPGAVNERDRVSRLFLDTWLRDDRTNGWANAPAFRWWQMGEEQWLSAESPDAVATQTIRFTLHGDGTLDERPAADEPARTFLADPKEPVLTHGGANVGFGSAGGIGIGPLDQSGIEKRSDVLSFTTEPLARPLRLFGRARVSFSFSTDQKDATFAVRLCDVYPDGRSMLVCDGAGRAKYREGTDHAAPVQPGEVYSIAFDLPPVGLTFLPGHRLRISVAGSNWPRFERNPHTGADHFDDAAAVPARHTIYFTPARPATLDLPALP